VAKKIESLCAPRHDVRLLPTMPVLTRSQTKYLADSHDAKLTALTYAEKYEAAPDAETKELWCLRFMAFLLVNPHLHELLQTDSDFHASVLHNCKEQMRSHCPLLLYQYCYAVEQLLSQFKH
jgi:hypothetical protein